MEKLLAICIPARNNAGELVHLLDAILSAPAPLRDKVDIVVSDDASTDGTRSLCAAYAKECRCLHYFANDRRVGRQANLELALGRGQAKYTWLFRPGDRILTEHLLNILRYLEAREPDVYIMEKMLFQVNEGCSVTPLRYLGDLLGKNYQGDMPTLLAGIAPIYLFSSISSAIFRSAGINHAWFRQLDRLRTGCPLAGLMVMNFNQSGKVVVDLKNYYFENTGLGPDKFVTRPEKPAAEVKEVPAQTDEEPSRSPQRQKHAGRKAAAPLFAVKDLLKHLPDLERANQEKRQGLDVLRMYRLFDRTGCLSAAKNHRAQVYLHDRGCTVSCIQYHAATAKKYLKGYLRRSELRFLRLYYAKYADILSRLKMWALLRTSADPAKRKYRNNITGLGRLALSRLKFKLSRFGRA